MTDDEVLQRGVVPCRVCGRPHDERVIERMSTGAPHRSSWADPDDGHTYYPKSAEQLARELQETPT